MPESIAFYLDPLCPYANQVAIWIREVRRLLPGGLDVEWRFFSLEAINAEEKAAFDKSVAGVKTLCDVAAGLLKKEGKL